MPARASSRCKSPDGKNLIMRGSTPGNIVDQQAVDLSDQMATTLIKDAFETLWAGGNRLLQVRGQTPQAGDAWIDVVLDDTPLRQAMISYSWRILGLSIVISLVTATLIFLALQWLLVRPMRNLTQRMVDFRANPEDMSRDDAAARAGATRSGWRSANSCSCRSRSARR